MHVSSFRGKKSLYVAAWFTIVLSVAGSAVAQTTITNAKRDVDGNYYADDTNSNVEVVGRITSANFATNYTQLFIQDTNDMAGILVFNDSPARQHLDDTEYSIGKEVQVYGIVGQENGLRYILADYPQYDVWFTDETPRPVPPVAGTISYFTNDAERWEGTYVIISNLTVSSQNWASWGNMGVVEVQDATGTLNIFIDEDTDADGQLAPTNTFSVRGIFAQYDTGTSPDGGYQIWIRSYGDVDQGTNQMPPQIYVEDSNVFSIATGEKLALRFLGQDRNYDDTLTLSLGSGPADASVTDHGNREGTFTWTPVGSLAGVTTNVVLEVTDGIDTGSVTISIYVLTEDQAGIVLNEVQWDPAPNMTGDASGDGTRDDQQDEFIEIYNKGSNDVDITGWTLEFGTNRTLFTFPSCTLTAKTTAVVFGGGTPAGFFGNAQVFAPASDWGGLSSSPSGRDVKLLTDTGVQIFSFYYAPYGLPDMSVTRLPDGTGGYTYHTSAVPFLLYSPGQMARYKPFPGSGLTNGVPLIKPVADVTLIPGEEWSLSFETHDAETNDLTLTALGLPSTALFEDNGDGTALLSYTGAVADAGSNFTVTVQADDGADTGTFEFGLAVLDASIAGLKINEVLADPNAVGYTIHIDSNNDGVEDADDDEFVEILNTSSNAIDMTGMEIWDGTEMRHTFGSYSLPAGQAVVVFGGGSTAGFIYSDSFTASSGRLDLKNDVETVSLYADDDTLIDQVSWNEQIQAVSWTCYPDGVGDATNMHDEVTGYARSASPGRTVDGASFRTNQPPILTAIQDQSAPVGSTLSFPVIAAEPDGDMVYIVASNLPANASFTPTNKNGTAKGGFTFTPSSGQNGSVYTVQFYAYDVHGADTQEVQITVTDPLPDFYWDFESGWQSWTQYNVSSDENWERRTGSGDGAESTDNYMQMNGYGADTNSEDWLLSPSIDLSGLSSPVLSFYSYYRYSGSAIVLRVSTDYSSGDPNGASWDNLNFTRPSSEQSWTVSGDVDLSAYEGETNVHLAIYYESASPSGGDSQWWQVDEVGIEATDPSQPSINITNPASNLSVPFATDTYTVSGNANTSTVGTMVWTNSLTGSNGTLSAQTSWSLGSIDLAEGANVISVRGANVSGDVGADSVTITRLPEPVVGDAELYISEYGEPGTGHGDDKYIELYNPGSNSVDLSGYELWKIANGGSWYEDVYSLSGTLAAGDVYMILNENSANADLIAAADETTTDGFFLFSGDDALGLARRGIGATNLIDVIGEDGADPGTGWEVAGIANATEGNVLVRKPTVTEGNANWTASAGTDAVNSEWWVWADLAYTNAGLPSSAVSESPSNQPPALAAIGNKSTTESNALVFAVTATDPADGDPITMIASNLPAGATFGSTNGAGTFFWTVPTPTGVYSVTFHASDNDGWDAETISITVGATGGGGTPLDISGYEVKQYDSSQTYTVPASTEVNPGGYVIIARDAAQSAFETYWGVSLGSDVVYLNSENVCPQINGDETYELTDGSSTIDGPSGLALASGETIQRNNTTDDATAAGSWTASADSSATPGAGANGDGTAGLVVNEYADASGSGNYIYEYVELYYDVAGGGPPPASNQPPVLAAIGNTSTTESNALVFAVTATDPVDGDPITMIASNLPTGATFGSTNGAGTFFWTVPTPTGSYAVTFHAYDKDGFDNETVTVKVTRAAAPGQGGVFISEYSEPDGGLSKYVEIFNNSGSPINMSNYRILGINNGGNWWESSLILTNLIVADGEVFVVVNSGSSDSAVTNEADQLAPNSAPMSFNGDDAVGLGEVVGGVTNLIDAVGTEGADPGSGWEVAGTANGTANHTLIRKSSVTAGNTNWTQSAGTDAGDSEWVVLAANTWTNIGEHTIDGGGPPPASNQPPVLAAIGNTSTTESNALVFAVTATDPVDGDPITMIASNLPAGATFGSTNGAGTFFWTVPTPTGSYAVTFHAYDKDGFDNETIDITVTPAPTPGAAELIISEYAEPGSGHAGDKYVELYNVSANPVDLSDYELWKISNGGEWYETRYDALSGILATGDVYLILNDASTNAILLAAADYMTNDAFFSFNGNDAIGLARKGIGATNLIDLIGENGADVVTGWDVAGTVAATKDHVLVRKASVTVGNTNWTSSAGTDTNDSEWLVWDDYTYTNAGLPTATDGGVPPGTPPVLDAVSDAFGTNGTPLIFGVTGSDPADSDPVTLVASNLPAGATFGATNGVGTFFWTAPVTGFYEEVIFHLFDKDGYDEASIDIMIYSTDRDNDGVPNWWEDRYGTGSTTSNGASNTDGDPASLIEEYIADTDPSRGESYYPNTMTNYVHVTNHLVWIQAGPPTTNSRIYDVWFATNLVGPGVTWTPLGLDKPGAADGGPIFMVVTNVPEATRFYRTGVKAP